MAEQIISPGVYLRENDISVRQPEPLVAGAAFIGPTVMGPVLEPVLVTSYNEYVKKFGDILTIGTNKKEYFTSIAVKNYFNQGGETVLVTRVVSGSYSSFTSATTTTVLAANTASAAPFQLKTFGKGVIYNSISTLGSDGSLPSGSIDNLRFEVASVNNNAGTFTLLIRRGDDLTRSKIILESFNVSLDPASDLYIEKVIGNQHKNYNSTEGYIEVIGDYPNRSNYVRVSAANAVNDYVPSMSGSLPTRQSGSFTGATGTVSSTAKFFNEASGSTPQGATSTSYDVAIDLLSNKDEYQFNLIAVPGLNIEDNAATINKVVSLAESRGDAIAVIDPVPYKALLVDVTTAAAGVDSSFAAAYWPWVQVLSATGKNVFVPASTIIPAVYALNDRVAAPWFAPAGLVRGGVPGVIQAERKLPKALRDTLYDNKVNPIATFPGQGISVLGQKTLQSAPTALDRVNVRRLIIELKEFVNNVSRGLLFEQNTIATRNRFLAAVNPYLESVVQRQGLFAYNVVMDDTNNTADIIDRNQLVGQIYIQPTKTVEFIVIDFVIQPTGASFE
jgi:phage tail sheath protein FI